MLTTSILCLLLVPFCAWNGLTYFSAYASAEFIKQKADAPLIQLLFNPCFYWLTLGVVALALGIFLLVKTLRTKKQDRIGQKLPLFISESLVLLLGLTMIFSTLCTNYLKGFEVLSLGKGEYVMEITSIVIGALIALVGAAFLFIQIFKGISPAFATKIESGRIYGFFRDYKSETKKVVWSSKKDVIRNTTVVVVTLVIVGVLVALIDLGFTQLMLLLGA